MARKLTGNPYVDYKTGYNDGYEDGGKECIQIARHLAKLPLYNIIHKYVEDEEKQIPKKTTKRQYVPNGTLVYGHCPNCDCFTKNDFSYCKHCGQALDWGQEE